MYKIIATPRGPLFHGLMRHIDAVRQTALPIATQSLDDAKAER